MGIEDKKKELVSLVKKAQKGDMEAMNNLVIRFQKLILKNSYINGKLNEDCIQELSIELIRSIKRFKFIN